MITTIIATCYVCTFLNASISVLLSSHPLRQIGLCSPFRFRDGKPEVHKGRDISVKAA